MLGSGYDVLLMPAASAFEDPAEPDSSLTVATVLKTGPHGYLRSLTDGRNTLDKQEGDREGELSLALYAHRMHSNGNVSRMFALGNSTMLVDDYIYQSTFNEQFLTAVLKDGRQPDHGCRPSRCPSPSDPPGRRLLPPPPQAGLGAEPHSDCAP